MVHDARGQQQLPAQMLATLATRFIINICRLPALAALGNQALAVSLRHSASLPAVLDETIFHQPLRI